MRRFRIATSICAQALLASICRAEPYRRSTSNDEGRDGKNGNALALPEKAVPLSEFQLKLLHPGVSVLDVSSANVFGALMESLLGDALRWWHEEESNIVKHAELHRGIISSYDRIELTAVLTRDSSERRIVAGAGDSQDAVHHDEFSTRARDMRTDYLFHRKRSICHCTVANFSGSAIFFASAGEDEDVVEIRNKGTARAAASGELVGSLPSTELLDGMIARWLQSGSPWHEELLGEIRRFVTPKIVGMEFWRSKPAMPDAGDREHGSETTILMTHAPRDAKDATTTTTQQQQQQPPPNPAHDQSSASDSGDGVASVAVGVTVNERKGRWIERPFFAGLIAGAAACLCLLDAMRTVQRRRQMMLVRIMYPEEEEVIFVANIGKEERSSKYLNGSCSECSCSSGRKKLTSLL